MLGLVVIGRVPFELAKQLGDSALLATRDELLQRSGYSSLLRRLTAYAEGSIKKVLVKCEVCGDVCSSYKL